MLVGQAWLAAGRRGHAATPSTTRTPGGRADPASGREEADPALRAHGALLARPRDHVPHACKYLSFTHSAIYLALLIASWLGRADGAKFVFGWAHGICWIVMSLLVHRRRPPARDPALAGRDGGRRRRRRAVRRAASGSSVRATARTQGTVPQRGMV